MFTDAKATHGKYVASTTIALLSAIYDNEATKPALHVLLHPSYHNPKAVYAKLAARSLSIGQHVKSLPPPNASVGPLRKYDIQDRRRLIRTQMGVVPGCSSRCGRRRC